MSLPTDRPTADNSAIHMAYVRRKRPTPRRAVAVGEIALSDAYDTVVQRRLPKGDALLMAEIAGIQGAKLAPHLMPLCHPLPLDLVRVRCLPVPERAAIRVYCEVATEARTGVEMEALAGVNGALLTIYDLTKPVQPALTLGAIRLLFKEGGKKGLWLHPDGIDEAERAHYRPRGLARLDGVACAVITLSDRAHAGTYTDAAGPLLVDALGALGGAVAAVEILPDGIEPLATRLRVLAGEGIGLILCTGGTGLGTRDLTPAALAAVATREVPGLGELFRSESRHHTPLAWLSCAGAVMIDQCLVIALPGSPKAVAEGMAILAPILAHAVSMTANADHPRGPHA